MSTHVIDAQMVSKHPFAGILVSLGDAFTPGDLAPT